MITRVNTFLIIGLSGFFLLTGCAMPHQETSRYKKELLEKEIVEKSEQTVWSEAKAKNKKKSQDTAQNTNEETVPTPPKIVRKVYIPKPVSDSEKPVETVEKPSKQPTIYVEVNDQRIPKPYANALPKLVILSGKKPYRPMLVGRPYKIKGITYRPKKYKQYDKTGVASWYGGKFHGRLTANGEVYDKHLLTAAHKTLPLPSYVRVTDMNTGKKLIVRINDRGPYSDGRIIDLSRGAAELLGIRGTTGLAKVRVQLASNQEIAKAKQQKHLYYNY